MLNSIFCTTTRSGTCHLQQPITTLFWRTARLVGSSHLLTDPAKTQRYRKGFRSGQGDALAVVFPGTLLELWRVLSACVDADKIILMQAANTGLTEGSTPNGNDYDREIVIISTLRLDKLHLLDKGEQVLAFPAPRSIRWKKR
jgi:D-lactate dehydrogenase